MTRRLLVSLLVLACAAPPVAEAKRKPGAARVARGKGLKGKKGKKVVVVRGKKGKRVLVAAPVAEPAVAPVAAPAAKPLPYAAAVANDSNLARPALGAAPAWKAPVPSSFTTPEGLAGVVLSRPGIPLVTLHVVVKAGSAHDPMGRGGLAAAVAAMLQDGGAGARTGPALAAAFAALGDELLIDVTDPDAIHFRLTVLSRHLPAALGLVSDLLVRPRFDAAEWARARDRQIAAVLKQRDEPGRVADFVYRRVLFEAHPYGAPPLGSPASVAALTDAHLREFYAARYGPRTTSVVLAGDVTPERAAELVGQAFAGWKSEAKPVPAPAAVAPGAPHLVIVDRPGAPQTEVRVGHVGLARATPDYAVARVLQMVLGGSFTSRLVQNLRERHGYTYGAGARFHLWDAPGPFVVRSAVRTDVTGPALKEILSEIQGIGKVSVEEAQKGRALVDNEVVDAFAVARDAAAALADLAAHNLPLDTWSRLPAALAPLDVNALGAAAGRLFRPANLAIVLVGDRAQILPQLQSLGLPAVEYRDADGAPVK